VFVFYASILCMYSVHVFYACIRSMYSNLSARLEIILAFAATMFFFRYVLFLFLDWRCVFYLMVLLMLCCFVVCFVFCCFFRSFVLLQVATLDCSWYG